MATYDLNQSQLYSVLGGSFISTHSQSPATIGTIIGALQSANDLPRRRVFSVNSIIQDDSNTTASLNLSGDTVGFFLELGSNATVNVKSTEPYGIVVAAGDGSGVILNDFAGNDTLVGGAGPDTLMPASTAIFIAGSGNNALYGGFSGDSNDTLQGGSGSSTLTVTTGNNTLIAGNGPETLNAGSGMDTLFGGGGPDSITRASNRSSIPAAAPRPSTPRWAPTACMSASIRPWRRRRRPQLDHRQFAYRDHQYQCEL